MPKGELVMLSGSYNATKFRINGAYVSEKLDGMRAIWLPETRGWASKDVPFFNGARDNRDYTCSGFWSRLGKPISVPDWFCETMPKYPLDGELFLGRGLFNETISVCRTLNPTDDSWKKIKYMVFDMPSYEKFYSFRDINTPNYEFMFYGNEHERFGVSSGPWWKPQRISDVLRYLRVQKANWADHVRLLEQELLPTILEKANSRLEEIYKDVIDAGGEGVMIRMAHSVWEPTRSKELVKLKPEKDIEGNVCGYTLGHGKLEGKIGSFRIKLDSGKEVDVSGFTDKERELFIPPGMILPQPGDYVKISISTLFPINTRITVKYNELTPDGIPRFPRYFRKRTDQ